ncbi:MAG TPA: glycosyltransferase [Nitrospiraceae bacterium]|jgi:GT2 family glycosyltransferase|nr:glycosyltransferase [Nitrospiraceae bacterium]
MLSVSLVIPVLNAARTLPRCLAALGRLDPKPDEIIFVDNGSSDGSQGFVKAFESEQTGWTVRCLVQPARGASAARNTGIKASAGEIIAFTDADCEPDTDWVKRLVVPFQDPAVGGVAGRIVGVAGGSVVELFSALYTLQSPEQPSIHTAWTPWAGGFPTANLAVRRSLLEQLGGFDESVAIYGEDYDLCARLYRQGAAIAYRPEAVVRHHHRTTLAGLLRQAYGFGCSHAYLFRRHGPRGLWLELPRCAEVWSSVPVNGWVDGASADKKMLGLLALWWLYPPLGWLLPLYALWLIREAGKRAARAGVPPPVTVAVCLAGLLLAKSAALTVGRWRGALRYGAVCL